MNPKRLGRSVPDTFDAKSADLTGSKMRRITRGVSFDHLVGECEQLVRDLEAERLSRPEIDHEVKFRGLLNRQVGRLLAFENALA